MKTNYDGIRGWLNYVRDYKDNKDEGLISQQRLIDANNIIKGLNDKIEKITYNYKEQGDLLKLRNKRIEVMEERYTSLIKRTDEIRKNLEDTYKEVKDLKKKLNEKELARRKNAGAIGGLNKKINEFKMELEKANHKINFLENSKRAPSKEEIIAYETRMKEVEKRQKSK